jgi:hypothetical protein
MGRGVVEAIIKFACKDFFLIKKEWRISSVMVYSISKLTQIVAVRARTME